MTRELEHGTTRGTLNRPPSLRLVRSHYCNAPRDISRSLVKRAGTLWEARKQAKYVEAVSNNASVDPAALRLLQRKYEPFAPRPIKEPTVFYGVRLGHVPGVYTSRKEAKPHTVGILSDFKRFKTRKLRWAQVITLGHFHFRYPSLMLFSIHKHDGSAAPSSETAGWGGVCPSLRQF